MTNDQYNTPFVLWHASFSRHLSFDIRHLAIHFPLSTLFVGLLSSSLVCAAGDQPPLKVAEHEGRLFITAGDVPVATYVFRDAEIARPHFAHVHAPGGLQVTRHHPPRAGVDPTDHATMHPGVWLAFGDISGSDFWRNKGRVEHLEFVEPPRAKTDGPDSIVSFAAKYRYVAGGKTICQELARHTIRAARGGYWFTFDSTFTGEDAFAFGDQEEMGLGIRLAIPFVVKAGNGTITSSAGGKNEKQVWGQPADWCDYSGIDIERKLRGGLLLVPHPENFRRSWMHARDYGLVVANPFGQNAFKQGPKSRVEVIPGEQLHLRFGVWSYAADLNQPVDHAALAAEYVQINRR